LEAFGSSDQQRTLQLIISQSLLSGISFDDLLMRSGLPRKVVETILTTLLAVGDIVQMAREPRLFLSKSAVESLKRGLLQEISAFLAANPLKQGMGKEELKTRLPKRSDARFFTPLLTALEKDGLVVPDREIVRPAGQAARPAAAAGGPDLGNGIYAFIAEGDIEPPTVKEIMERFRCNEKHVRDNLALLTRSGQIARISADLFYSSAALDGLREKLIALLREKGEITPPEYRERTGLSRKFLIPLLEHFDSEKVTIRVGDKRVLRRR